MGERQRVGPDRQVHKIVAAIAFVFRVRVSCVWSPTMVTSVSGRRLPVLSETVPVMPPKVFCALAYGASDNDPSRVKAMRNAASPILLFMRAPVNICDRRYDAILLLQRSQRRRLTSCDGTVD